jgi:hypothetical protein
MRGVRVLARAYAINVLLQESHLHGAPRDEEPTSGAHEHASSIFIPCFIEEREREAGSTFFTPPRQSPIQARGQTRSVIVERSVVPPDVREFHSRHRLIIVEIGTRSEGT